MKIHIGASKTRNLQEAKSWLVSNENFRALIPEIESWAISKERNWGECYVFIEVSIPQGLRFPGVTNNQIDLLIVFSDNAALCELKGNDIEGKIILNECIQQLNSQVTWLEGFQEKRISNTKVCPILLAYGLEANDVKILNQRLPNTTSEFQIWVAGVHPELRGQYVGDRPLFFPQTLDAKLIKFGLPFSYGRRHRLQEFILQEIKKSREEVKSFNNFSEAINYLEKLPSVINKQPGELFVPGIRREDLNQVIDLLEEKRIVELVGPPGIGKSSLALEVINVKEDSVWEINFQECDTVIKICHAVWSNISTKKENIGEETYIQHILDQPLLFWIRGYDETSTSSLNRFFQILQSKTDFSNKDQARWLVESKLSLTSLRSYSYQVKPLDNDSLSLILDKWGESGGAFQNPEEVFDRARGNPHKAILLWQSQNLAHAEEIGEVSWFIRQLNIVEKRILLVLCWVVSKAPFGITAKDLAIASEEFCGDLLPHDIKNAVESVLRKLENYQLANITRFEKGIFNGLLDKIFPSDFSLVIVNHLESSLIDFGVSAFTEEEQNEFNINLEKIFHNLEDIDTLGFITVYLNYYGDIEPFFRSSFRYTSLGQFIEWVDATGWKPKNRTQTYLLKALRVLYQMRRKAEGEIGDFEDELGLPDAEDKAQLFAYDFVQSRSLVVKKIEDDFDYKSWLKEAFKCKDEDLRAVKLVSIIYAFHNTKRNQDVWKILPELPKFFKENSTPKGLAAYTNLEFLNKTTFRKEIQLPDEEAYPKIEQYAREYIKEGLRVENIQVICDGLYCYSRAQEFREQTLRQYSKVLDYLTVLQYVENAPRTRARQRIKIVLTQGSIFRHYCKNPQLRWNDFLPAFERALFFYSRAFQAALSQKHSMHIANATSYMMELSTMSLRYYNENNALDIIAENLNKTIEVVKKVELSFDGLLTWETEINVFSTIKRNFPALLYAHVASKKFLNENEKNDLKERVTSCINELLEEIESVEIGKEIKLALNVMKNFRRAISYGGKRNNQQNLILINLLRRQLNYLLDEIKWLRRRDNFEFNNEWVRLSNLVNSNS